MSTVADTPIGRGRTSDVFAHGEDRAIKLYPAGESRAAIEQECAAAVLVHELGVPSVACHGLTERDGRLGIIFERLDGPSLGDLAERDLRALPSVCRTLADLHVQMHSARAAELPDVRELAVGLLDTPALQGLSAHERSRLTAHVRGLPDGDSVLHLDFHPQNVFQHKDGYAIIDWHSACRGTPAADVAMSVVLMREVELFPGTPWPKLLLYSLARRVILHFYLQRYLATTTVTRAEARDWVTCARVLRLGLLDVASERGRFLRRIRRAARKARA
ncbi:MAG: aminoglycoside phosphotransferase family protein [Propionicimonas sp.]